ncbi:chorismate synthase, partial [Ruminococcus sp.]
IIDRIGCDMIAFLNTSLEGGESLGGVIECAAVNVPAGIGSPVFDGLENNIAQLVFGIPGVRGLEFGAGFTSAKMVGSQNNDEFYVNDHGHVLTKTNNHGGIIGGISSGMPITLRVAMKPSEYTAGVQTAVNYRDMTSETVESDMHIPCTVPAAVPCVEAAVNIALLSHMLDYPNFC